jgi:hypothetical protein
MEHCLALEAKSEFMRLAAVCKRMIATDTGALILSALCLVALHSATNNQYGFHRDELAIIDDARFLGWGYVAIRRSLPSLRGWRSRCLAPR